MIRMIDYPAFSSGRAAGQGMSRTAWKAVKGHIRKSSFCRQGLWKWPCPGPSISRNFRFLFS